MITRGIFIMLRLGTGVVSVEFAASAMFGRYALQYVMYKQREIQQTFAFKWPIRNSGRFQRFAEGNETGFLFEYCVAPVKNRLASKECWPSRGTYLNIPYYRLRGHFCSSWRAPILVSSTVRVLGIVLIIVVLSALSS